MKKKKEQDSPIKIREFVVFALAVRENAERIALALTFSGYFVRCSVSSSGYIVRVFTDRELPNY